MSKLKAIKSEKMLALPGPENKNSEPGVKIFAVKGVNHLAKNQRKVSFIPWVVLVSVIILGIIGGFVYTKNPNIISTPSDRVNLNDSQTNSTLQKDLENQAKESLEKANKSAQQAQTAFDITQSVDSLTLNSRIYYLVGKCSTTGSLDTKLPENACAVWIIDRLGGSRRLLVPNLWGLDVINENLGSISSFRLAAAQTDLEISLIVSSTSNKYGLLTLTVDDQASVPAFTKIFKLYEIKPTNTEWTTYYR